ncbi:hypothetical protein DUI87_14888 [Hirundo rustica rustica]|uniref:EF-hand domain-containing protein n=1 Tax=Hirundo rustica rustica TaxID=333673 RepID=A0A3M0KC41_HIRRU|nr:hypothetical protein DUI87_14888 [Hirundo rustica rustica]
MKKRKELNALIGLAADGRRKKPAKKGSGHRLLRTEPPASDSESSSDEDEFAGTRGPLRKVSPGPGSDGSGSDRGDYLRCCRFCYPLCAFVILAACVVACVGLVWMQVALKEDLDAIKEKFRTMESNQKTSFQEIPKLNEDLVQNQKQLEQIETGELGLSKIWINITEINKQISLLTSTVNHLKNNIKSAADLISLPLTVEKLQKTVANIGSTLTSVAHDVENIQTAIEEYKKSIEILQNDVESQALHAALEQLNNTVVVYQKLNDIKLLNVDSAIGNLSQKVTLLENSALVVKNLEKRENSSAIEGNDATTSLQVENEDQLDIETQSNKELKEAGTRDSQVSKLKETLQLISAITGKSENDRPIEASKNDLQKLFEKAPADADGKLSCKDLQKLLGSTAQESQSFKEFDTDGDEKYTLRELRLALGAEGLGSKTSKGGFTKDKTLDSILNVEMVKEKSAEEITQIWNQYFSAKDTVYAVIPADKFDLMWKRAQNCPSFLYALPRKEGYEFFVGQWSGTELHFTSLINVQTQGETAPSQLVLYHYPDLQKEKGIVLMTAEMDSKFLVVHDAQCLANQVQLFYATEHSQTYELVETFNHRSSEFKYMSVIAELEQSGLGRELRPGQASDKS